LGAFRGSVAAVEVVVLVLGGLVLVPILAPATADSGGPDAYGYTWVDSKAPNPGVSFSWIDGVTGGTDLGLDDEGCTSDRLSLPFSFRFYGVLFSSTYVCANGFLAFNIPASNPEDTDAFVAAFGADLDPGNPSSGHVYATADILSSPRRFVVTWNGVYMYETTDPQTFQIVLIEDAAGNDGRILFQYASLTNPPAALAGIMSLLGTSSLYYTSPLEDSLAVMFLPPGMSPPGDVLTVRGANLAPATVEPGRKDVPMLRLNFSTPTNAVNLRRVRVDVTGITSMPGDVSRIALWKDADRNGVMNPALDALAAAAAPSGTPEFATLTLPAPYPIPAGPGENFFVAFDLSLTAVPGDWIGAGVMAASYVTVDPPDNVSSANFPLNTYISGVRTLIVEGADTLRVTSWSATNPENVTQWQADVPMFAFTVDADKG
jgi:hypothetical protein